MCVVVLCCVVLYCIVLYCIYIASVGQEIGFPPAVLLSLLRQSCSHAREECNKYDLAK
jgi:hypothetical protein